MCYFKIYSFIVFLINLSIYKSTDFVDCDFRPWLSISQSIDFHQMIVWCHLCQRISKSFSVELLSYLPQNVWLQRFFDSRSLSALVCLCLWYPPEKNIFQNWTNPQHFLPLGVSQCQHNANNTCWIGDKRCKVWLPRFLRINIEVETEWVPFCRAHFQFNFVVRKLMYFDSNFIYIFSKESI